MQLLCVAHLKGRPSLQPVLEAKQAAGPCWEAPQEITRQVARLGADKIARIALRQKSKALTFLIPFFVKKKKESRG